MIGTGGLLEIFLPWIAYLGLIFTFVRLFRWARNKKTGALVIGLLFQAFLPDPYAERTIKVVQEAKKTVKKSQGENGDPLNDTLEEPVNEDDESTF